MDFHNLTHSTKRLGGALLCLVFLFVLVWPAHTQQVLAQEELPPEPTPGLDMPDAEQPEPTPFDEPVQQPEDAALEDHPSDPVLEPDLTPEPGDDVLRAPEPDGAPIHTADSTERRVSTSGSDTGDCTVTACATIAYAVGQSVSGDTIRIAAGTYANTNVYTSKNLTFMGDDLDTTILDGGDTDSVIYCTANVPITIMDMTIQNGNTGTTGGGVRSDGDVTLQHVKLTSNNAGTYGGGIYTAGNLTITGDVIISDNDAVITGGGIYSVGQLYMIGVKVSGNKSNTGGAGGIYSKGTTFMSDVAVTNNETNGPGGGIWLSLDQTEGATLQNATISGNKALASSKFAGGLLVQRDDTAGFPVIDLTNVTISGNSTASYGAAIHSVYSYVNMLNVTITNNSGSLPAIYSTTYGSSYRFKNSINANNSGGNCNKSGGATFTSDGYNIDSLEVSHASSCDFDQAGDQSATDPLLLALADNGGPTQTHAIQQTSPALDSASNNDCPSTDQRGMGRPNDGDGDGTATCDVGAYEFISPSKTKTFTSNGTYDGWVLESTRTSSKGGTLNKTAATLSVGDDAGNRQYRAILHFNTASLPDNAVITAVKLQVKRAGIKGTNPFNTHGALYVDLRKGAFSNNAALQAADWQAPASKLAAGKIPKTSASNWHTLNLAAANFKYINKTGVTQLRLRFAKQDNGDNGADTVNFYSGNAAADNRPKLIITYYVP